MIKTNKQITIFFMSFLLIITSLITFIYCGGGMDDASTTPVAMLTTNNSATGTATGTLNSTMTSIGTGTSTGMSTSFECSFTISTASTLSISFPICLTNDLPRRITMNGSDLYMGAVNNSDWEGFLFKSTLDAGGTSGTAATIVYDGRNNQHACENIAFLSNGDGYIADYYISSLYEVLPSLDFKGYFASATEYITDVTTDGTNLWFYESTLKANTPPRLLKGSTSTSSFIDVNTLLPSQYQLTTDNTEGFVKYIDNSIYINRIEVSSSTLTNSMLIKINPITYATEKAVALDLTGLGIYLPADDIAKVSNSDCLAILVADLDSTGSKGGGIFLQSMNGGTIKKLIGPASYGFEFPFDFYNGRGIYWNETDNILYVSAKPDDTSFCIYTFK